jgi:thymidylate synthase
MVTKRKNKCNGILPTRILKIMNNLDKQYQNLLQDILDNGVTKSDRTGTGTLSVFGRQIRHKMSEGFPLLTTKKMPFRLIATELLWFLRGDTNIKFLVDNNCHIWDGDAYKSYSDHFIGYEDVPNKELFIEQIKTDDEFAKKWGDLGPVYGKQWRKWGNDEEYHNGSEYVWYGPHDQIANLINDLKTNPDSRRLMVNAWNVGELDQMVLPPCHYGFQVYTREMSISERVNLFMQGKKVERFLEKITNKDLDAANIPTRSISLMWNQRSCDIFLGIPFNIASYGLLLEILAKEVNMVPDELIGNLGDTHLYSNHVEQAKEQIGRQMTWEEKIQWVIKNTDIEMDNVLITEESYKKTTPTHTREPYPLPTLNQFPTYTGTRPSIESYVIGDFTLKDYQSHPSIKAPLSN